MDEKFWIVTRKWVVQARSNPMAIDETNNTDYDGNFIGDGVEIRSFAAEIDLYEAREASRDAGSEIHTLWGKND